MKTTKTIKQRIVEVYQRRQKALNESLKCDIEIDKILMELDKKVGERINKK